MRYQHEFALAGFRTLVLINGGAIIALLTYAGNVLDRAGARGLATAFGWYVVGVVATTLAYVVAYYSQGMLMEATGVTALRRLGLIEKPEKQFDTVTRNERWGNILIIAGVVLSVAGLVGFVVGSIYAMRALT